jgi:hypothetical protein
LAFRSWIEKNVASDEEFDYSNIDALTMFKGTHPEVMRKRIDAMNWKFSYDLSKRSSN